MRYARFSSLLLAALLVGHSAAAPPVRSTCTLLWDAVTTYEDGTPATSLQGYRVYTTTTRGSYHAPTLQVGEAVTQTTCQALGLTEKNQTYYVVVTALDDLGEESDASNELAIRFKGGVRVQP